MSPYGSRARYVNDSIATASPSRLLTMLYDRLVLDLARAEEAQRAKDRSQANACLVHAQAIILELKSSLKVDAWDGGPALASIYTFVYSELVAANVQNDPKRTAVCRELVEPLRDAWHEAARTAGASGAARLVATPA